MMSVMARLNTIFLKRAIEGSPTGRVVWQAAAQVTQNPTFGLWSLLGNDARRR